MKENGNNENLCSNFKTKLVECSAAAFRKVNTSKEYVYQRDINLKLKSQESAYASLLKENQKLIKTIEDEKVIIKWIIIGSKRLQELKFQEGEF